MTAQGTVLQQRPSKVLHSGPKAARLQRLAQRVISQAQPSKPAQQSRPNTAVQASAVAEAPTHTSRVSEKALGDGPSVINGQVSRVQLISACFYTYTYAASAIWLYMSAVLYCLCCQALQSLVAVNSCESQPDHCKFP